MADDTRERFWEVTCTLTPVLYFGLVMTVCLLLLSLVSLALVPRSTAARTINLVNLVVSVGLLALVLYLIRTRRDVYN
jgi:hypothetical protein